MDKRRSHWLDWSNRLAPASGPSTGVFASLKRAARTLAIAPLVAGSLLTFPSAVAWMIAGWLLWHTWAVLHDRAGWLPLVTCAGIVLVKQVGWTLDLFALAAAALVALTPAAVRVLSPRHNDSRKAAMHGKRLAGLAVGLLWIAWALFVFGRNAGEHAGHTAQLKGARPVVLMGDSLSSGIVPSGAYATHLRRLISLPVVDLSRPGIATDQAFQQLPALVEANPQVVVIELGGHDFLRGRSRRATCENLERMITACRRIGAEVVLVEIPRGFLIDPYRELEREIARQYDLELVCDTPIRRLVLQSPFSPPGTWLSEDWHLSDDGLHPNARGSQLLARYIADALARLYGERIRSGEVTTAQ